MKPLSVLALFAATALALPTGEKPGDKDVKHAYPPPPDKGGDNYPPPPKHEVEKTPPPPKHEDDKDK